MTRVSVAAVMQALAAWAKYPPPPEFARELGSQLGEDGAAALFLRDVRAGAIWHERAAAGAMEGDARIPAKEVLLCGTREQCKDLKTWWQTTRLNQSALLRGVTTRERAASVQSMDSSGMNGPTYLEWVENKRRRFVQLPRGMSRARQELIESWKKSELQAFEAVNHPAGEMMSSFVTWWIGPREHCKRFVMEFEAEPSGLLLAVLVVASKERSLAALHSTLLDSAWTLAGIAARSYWALWERTHRRSIDAAILKSGVVNPGAAPGSNPVEVFECIAPRLDSLLTAMAGALQAPVAGLFLTNPVRREVDLVSHVGYRNHGEPQTLPYQRGLTRLFSSVVKPIILSESGAGAAFQLRSPDQIRDAYHKFLIGEPVGTPAKPDARDITAGCYATDALIHDELWSSAVAGPWSWAHVELDPSIWHAPPNRELNPELNRDLYRDRYSVPEKTLREYRLQASTDAPPAGVLKLQGRIRSEIDIFQPPPPYTERELTALHGWAGLFAVVFQRMVNVYERELSNRLIQGAIASLSHGVQDLAVSLRDALSAKAVLLLVEHPRSETFRIVAEHWQTTLSDRDQRAIWEQVMRADDGAPGRRVLAMTGDGHPARADHDAAFEVLNMDGERISLNAHFQPVIVNGKREGLLVVVGAPASLRSKYRDTSCQSPFPPLLRPSLRLLGGALAGRPEFRVQNAQSGEPLELRHGRHKYLLDEVSAQETGNESPELRHAWHRLFHQGGAREMHGRLDEEMRTQIYQMACDLAAYFKQQNALARVLEIEPQTVRKHLLRLIGPEDAKGGIEWRDLAAQGRPVALKDLTQRIADLADAVAARSVPP